MNLRNLRYLSPRYVIRNPLRQSLNRSAYYNWGLNLIDRTLAAFNNFDGGVELVIQLQKDLKLGVQYPLSEFLASLNVNIWFLWLRASALILSKSQCGDLQSNILLANYYGRGRC